MRRQGDKKEAVSDRQNEDKKGLRDSLMEIQAKGKLVDVAVETEVAGAAEQIKERNSWVATGYEHKNQM